jgi:hypothetical protein
VKIGERRKLSPIVFAGGVEFGRANAVRTLGVPSMDNRMQVRDEARKKGVAAARWWAPAPHAGKQDPPAFRFLAAAVEKTSARSARRESAHGSRGEPLDRAPALAR